MVTLAGNKQIVYLYDAAGTKLAQVLRQPNTADVRTDYVGEFVYHGGVLEFFSQPEGRCVAAGAGFRYEYHYRDHLGNLRLAFSDLDGDGEAEVSEVLQEAAYYPYGMRHEGLAAPAVGVPHRFLFQGKELEGAFGVDWMDFGARRYDAQVGRWWGVDAMANDRSDWTPYRFGLDNPIRYLDRDGNNESTWVTQNDDGTYSVFGGNANDGSNAIVLFENGAPARIVGYSATPESFYFSEKGTWQGTISSTDQSGRNFLNQQILLENPSVPYYMYNATGGMPYDFKRTNGTENSIFTTRAQHYRGMPIGTEWNGKQIYASARDVGNIAAGIVAGRSGMDWRIARLGFDGLESYQKRGLAAESSSTQYAQKLGWEIGRAFILKSEYSRLPGNGHLQDVEIPIPIIFKGELQRSK
jgi:RHS repeat-associated protein